MIGPPGVIKKHVSKELAVNANELQELLVTVDQSQCRQKPWFAPQSCTVTMATDLFLPSQLWTTNSDGHLNTQRALTVHY